MWRMALALIVVAGCAAVVAGLVITEDQTGQTFQLVVGQTGEISLKMSSGTGYTWELGPVDPALLRVGEKRIDVENPTMPGAPVRVIWPITALARGRATVEAQLVRPWMRDKPAAKFTATIVIP